MATQKSPTVLIDDELEEELNHIKSLRDAQKSLKKTEDEIMLEVKPNLCRFVEEFPDTKLQFGDRVVNPVKQVRRSVDVERLLELGVSPEIVEKATVENEIISYRIS